MAYVQQIVTSNEYKALQEVRQILFSQKGCESLETLVYPKLSVLVREKEVVTPNWDWRATFLLVQQPSLNIRLQPVAIVRVVENHPDTWSMKEQSIDQYIRKICPVINADYFLFVMSSGSLIRAEHLQYYNPTNTAQTSKSFNFFQYMCTVSFCPDIQTHKGEELFVCHEPSLDSFLDLKEAHDIINKVNSESNVSFNDQVPKSFFSNSSVDALVCLGMPNGIPLFGIEFDGSTHDKPYQQAKDKAKDEIFKSNNVPLLRVKSSAFDTQSSNFREYLYINYQIGRSLIEGILSDGYFIKLLVHYLKNEGARAGESTNTGSNILALAKRVDEFFERQKRSILTLSERAAGWEDQMEEFLNNHPDNKLSQQLSEEAQFGIPVDSVQPKWGFKGLTITLEFAPNKNERKIMNRTAFSFGPYNVVDATGSYDFSDMLCSCMEAVVRRKASESLNEGSPSIKDKLRDLQSLTYIQNMTHNQRVNHFSCNNYMAMVINWIHSDPATTDPREAPPSPIHGIKDVVLNNLPNNEKDPLISDLNKIHDFLVTQNIAKFLFDKNDCQNISTNAKTMIVALGGIKEALGDKTLLHFVNDIEAWRSIITPVRKLWSSSANRMSKRQERS